MEILIKSSPPFWNIDMFQKGELISISKHSITEDFNNKYEIFSRKFLLNT